MTNLSTRETLDRKIQQIHDSILILGSMVEQAALDAVDALKKRDVKTAKKIYTGDVHINAKRYEIENDCLILIATQQPMARDLRTLASVFEIANELERMGDYAKGIAKICIMLGDQPLVKPLVDLPRMANLTSSMLHRALSAFVRADVETARQIPKEDLQVDELYKQVFRELISFMIADPRTIHQANYLLWAAHNLERMSDRVTNICERTIYVATGVLGELKESDDEQTQLPPDNFPVYAP